MSRGKSGKARRLKGHNFEREISNRMAEIWPDAKRGLSQSRGAAAERTPDVVDTPYWIECKCGSKPPLMRAWDQAVRETDGRAPMVIARRIQQGSGETYRPSATIVMVSLDQMMGLLERVWTAKGGCDAND
jgi:hypothetical protein